MLPFRSVFREHAPSSKTPLPGFLGSAHGVSRENSLPGHSLSAPKGKKMLLVMLPEAAHVRRRKLVIFCYFFGFFGEMTHGKGSLGLDKTNKHSFTLISLILFLISSISLLRGFWLLREFLLVLEEIEGRLKATIYESLEGRLKATICDRLEGRLNATIVIFNHIGEIKR
jgi:hypothetical protein